MEILQNALIEAIKESMGIDLIKDNAPLESAYSSRITLDKATFILAFNEPLLRQFASDFLDTPNPSTDALVDIAKELANQILGKAKVLFEEKGEIFKLGIPEFIGWEYITEYKCAFNFKYNDMKICLYEV